MAIAKKLNKIENENLKATKKTAKGEKASSKTNKSTKNKVVNDEEVEDVETKAVVASVQDKNIKKKQTGKENSKKSSKIEKEDKSKEKKVKDKNEEKEDNNLDKKNKALKVNDETAIQEAVKVEMKKSKKIPKEELGKINTEVFKNICIAICVMLYLDFVVLGFKNIENRVLMTDLKVFSVGIFVISVYFLEKAYKIKSKAYLAYSIETLLLSFFTIMLIYLNIIIPTKIMPIIVLVAYLFSIYYTLKAIIIYKKLKKKYYIDSMKKIIKK